MIKKQLAVLLSLLLVSTSVLTACKDSDKNDSSNIEPSGNVNTGVTDLEKMFISDGKSDYKIVVGETAPAGVYTAAAEMQYFLQKSTGYTMEIVTDDTITINDSMKYISLGQNNIYDYYDIELNQKELNYTGYIIQTKGDSVLISGADLEGKGTLYGTYKFLYHMIDFECFHADEVVYSQKDDVNLKDFNLTVVPALGYSVSFYGEVIHDASYMNRLGLTLQSAYLSSFYGEWHNSMNVLDYENNAETHVDWFYQDYQPCLTAKGNPISRNAMVAFVGDRLIEALDKNPGMRNVTFTQMDNNAACNCESCSALYKAYGGSKSVVWMLFCNDVQDYVDAHYAELETERDYRIYFFVYQHTFDCPVIYNADGTVEKYDDVAVCNSKVSPFFATWDVNWLKSYYDEENAKMEQLATGWDLIADDLGCWNYSTNFWNYLVPYIDIPAIQGCYQFFRDKGFVFNLNQTQNASDATTGFQRLKTYLISCVTWDPDCNLNEKIDNFFANYFKDAVKPMRKYFDELCVLSDYHFNVMGVKYLNPNVVDSQYYSYNTLMKWMGYFEEAYENIDYLKTQDPDLYESLRDRIDLESISVRYLLIEIYAGYFDSIELYQMKKDFKTSCNRLNIQYAKEGGDITDLWSKWGI